MATATARKPWAMRSHWLSFNPLPVRTFIRYRTRKGRVCVEGPIKTEFRLEQRTLVLLNHVGVQPGTVEVIEREENGWER